MSWVVHLVDVLDNSIYPLFKSEGKGGGVQDWLGDRFLLEKKEEELLEKEVGGCAHKGQKVVCGEGGGRMFCSEASLPPSIDS